MNDIKVPVIAATLLIMQWPGVFCGGQIDSIKPEDSLVIVTSSALVGKKAGNGFVYGNGTIVLTAHHLVFEESEQGQHKMAGLVTLFSPYLGEALDAEIIASDEQLDLAILKVNWPGHPALKFADDKSITHAGDMRIIGMPGIIHSLAAEAASALPQSIDVQRENLEVDFVAMRRGVPRFISLSGTGKLGDGWSGSPMLLTRSSQVAGCFVSLHHTAGQSTKTSQGPAIRQAIGLVDEAGQARSLYPAKSVISRPEDGIEVCLLCLRAYKYYTAHKYELAYKDIQALINKRPQSAFAYVLAANIAEKQDKYEQAGEYYEKALKLTPKATALKIFYAQYLSEREPDKALEILNKMWEGSDTAKPATALLMFNILSERGEFQRCIELLNDVLEVNPDNAYLRINLGACLLSTDKTDEAISSISKAVELMPERGPFRGQLAHLLEANGKLDEAEKHFRKLLEIEPENPVVHMWLAKFLSKHRPPGGEEALKEAQTALALPLKGGLTKQKIEQFINELKSKSDEKTTSTVDEKLKVKGL